MSEPTDLGEQLWFKTLVGLVFLIAAALTALGLYTVTPVMDGAIDAHGYIIATAIGAALVLVVSYLITAMGRRVEPPTRSLGRT